MAVQGCPTLVRLLACVAWVLVCAVGAQEITCRPQEGLALDAPYLRPQYLPKGTRLPLCQQYDCTCCNRTHALTLHRDVRGAIDDESFSRRCADFLGTLACRVCDPEVGAGLKPAVCPATCSAWHAACQDDYFGFDPRSDRLVPCDHDGVSSGRMLLCSKLSELVADGPALCGVAGYTVAEGPNTAAQPCFDGVAPRRPDLCERPPTTTSSSTSSSKSKSSSASPSTPSAPSRQKPSSDPQKARSLKKKKKKRRGGAGKKTALESVGGVPGALLLLAAAYYLLRGVPGVSHLLAALSHLSGRVSHSVPGVSHLTAGVTGGTRYLLATLAALERRIIAPVGTVGTPTATAPANRPGAPAGQPGRGGRQGRPRHGRH